MQDDLYNFNGMDDSLVEICEIKHTEECLKESDMGTSHYECTCNCYD